MREELKRQLIKDIIIAAVAWIVVAIIFIATMEFGFLGGLIMGFACAGIPFGWRWLSNIFTAISLYSVIIKAVLAIILGWIALPVVIIKDIIAYKNAE